MNRCDCCGTKKNLERVDTKDFHGMFCPTCRSMMEQTTRDDGTSRLHPSHIKQLQQTIRFNQASKCPCGKTPLQDLANTVRDAVQDELPPGFENVNYVLEV